MVISIKVEGTVPGIEAAVRSALRGLSADLYAAANDLDGGVGGYLIEARDTEGGGTVLYGDDGVAKLDPETDIATVEQVR
jgi:hypothetical protein